MIARYFSPLAAPGGLNLKDDAAYLTPPSGMDLVMTVDAVVAGVHFFSADAPEGLARKALGVNISDLAAKGAEPGGFLLTLGLSDDWAPEWLEAFAGSLQEAAAEWRCPLYGGDTVRANGAPFISITAFGFAPHGRMVQRSGAQVGDSLCVSGTIGDAALGLFLAGHEKSAWAGNLTGEEKSSLLDRYHHPRPRIALVPVIRQYATAAMDISDGLVGDLEKLLSVSNVSAEVSLEKIPLSSAAAAAFASDQQCLHRIMTGGDDYEILCTIPGNVLEEAMAEAASINIGLTPIGIITAPDADPVFRYKGSNVEIMQKAFSHF